MNQTAEFPKNDRKVIRHWALFDWANSAFYLVIATAIFPSYFEAKADSTIQLWGSHYNSNALYSWSVSAAYLIIALISPLLSGIADRSGRRLFFMRWFTSIGSIACLLLLYFKGMETLWLGIGAFMLAIISVSGSILFYNSLLPIIATEDRYDDVSAKGFSYGYFGSVLLLVFNLVMVMKPSWFGFADEFVAMRWAFFSVGVWWWLFAWISFKKLPQDKESAWGKGWFTEGYQELKRVFKDLQRQKSVQRFLTSYFFFNAGVQTIIFLASVFAKEELGFETSDLIILILIIQLVAIAGSYLFANISKRIGNIKALLIAIGMWVFICLCAYLVNTQTWFYVIGMGVGLVLGGIQSLSRATYAKLIPENTPDLSSYFSFYDVLEKVSIVMGTFVFGLLGQMTGNLRASVLSVAILFIIGGLLLLSLQKKARFRPMVPQA